jgi:hypothetical protein
MSHAQTFTDYHEAVRAHDVALSLKWIVRIGHSSGNWWVEYVGRAA